ncbi:MAG: response regulator transcription factor [Clostridia bacterium]|nr:response regulator transcription factor [Clostridia bacterium]
MIYCVEDDTNIRQLVVYTLKNSGFDAYGFEDGAQLYEAMEQQTPELILLDVMLPGEDGFSILRALRQKEEYAALPVIMVTAKDSEYDKVLGLDQGADDYITKPFGMMELISRIKAVLRRSTQRIESAKPVLRAGEVCLEDACHKVTVKGEKVELTLKEYELLKFLLKNRGKVLTRDVLLAQIWGYDFDGETRTVDVHMRTLRQKLGTCGELIETVRGVGYRIGDAR